MCGINLQAQRYEFLNMTSRMEARELIPAMDHYYNLLGFTYDINYYCYYGAAQFLTLENLRKIWLELDVIKNIMFNIGIMYTDVVMIAIGVPGQTLADYMYYLFFYLGDLFFRFFFREEAIPLNCWYPWNYKVCESVKAF